MIDTNCHNECDYENTEDCPYYNSGDYTPHNCSKFKPLKRETAIIRAILRSE